MRQRTDFGAKDSIQFHKQNCNQHYQYTQLEVTPNFDAVFHTVYQQNEPTPTGRKSMNVGEIDYSCLIRNGTARLSM